jgi:hypothetical protein
MIATIQTMAGSEILIILLACLILIPLLIALFQWLWNITMPQVFNLNAITFWQAFRLLLISGFLFRATGGE